MSYFFSQPDGDDEPTIWLETGELNAAIPMLRRSSLRGPHQAELHAAQAWPARVTLRALERHGLLGKNETLTTLGTAVLALLDDQKKDA